MANIFLIQPPLTSDELYARGSKTSASMIPPLGIAYIASYLRRYGHDCTIFDGLLQPVPLAELCQKALSYDVIGITVNSAFALRAIELIQALKVAGVQAPLVVGGPHVTALPEALLDYGADYAVVGEGEATSLELVNNLTSGEGSIREIAGVVFKENGVSVFTGRRDLIEPLDSLPLPARDLLPMHLYSASPARSSRQPSHSAVLSRGCPGICSFCSKKTFGTKVRYFSPDRIVEEFFLLRDKYGAKDIAVLDDNFAANHDIILETSEKLIRRQFGISWSVEARIDGVNREILKALKRAGCSFICYGIESGSQRLLDYMNKKITKDQIRYTIRITKEVGIPIRGYFMLGLPTETLKEMEETVNFSMELDLDVASFSLFVPFPGTLEYQRALKSGCFPDPEFFHHMILPEFNFIPKPIYIPGGMSANELLAMHRHAYNRYYFRPKWLLSRLMAIRSMGELGALINGGLTLIKNALSR